MLILRHDYEALQILLSITLIVENKWWIINLLLGNRPWVACPGPAVAHQAGNSWWLFFIISEFEIRSEWENGRWRGNCNDCDSAKPLNGNTTSIFYLSINCSLLVDENFLRWWRRTEQCSGTATALSSELWAPQLAATVAELQLSSKVRYGTISTYVP